MDLWIIGLLPNPSVVSCTSFPRLICDNPDDILSLHIKLLIFTPSPFTLELIDRGDPFHTDFHTTFTLQTIASSSYYGCVGTDLPPTISTAHKLMICVSVSTKYLTQVTQTIKTTDAGCTFNFSNHVKSQTHSLNGVAAHSCDDVWWS